MPDANLPATLRGGEYLGRIQSPIRIEHCFQLSHNRQIVFMEDQRHQLVLSHPDSVLAGDGAADRYAIGKYLRPSRDHLAIFSLDASIEQDQRMQVAVSGVENV